MSKRERKMWKRAWRMLAIVRQLVELNQAWQDDLVEVAHTLGSAGVFACIGVTQAHMRKIEPLDRELKKLSKRNTRRMRLEIANGYPMWLVVTPVEKKGIVRGRCIDYPLEVEQEIRLELLRELSRRLGEWADKWRNKWEGLAERSQKLLDEVRHGQR